MWSWHILIFGLERYREKWSTMPICIWTWWWLSISEVRIFHFTLCSIKKWTMLKYCWLAVLFSTIPQDLNPHVHWRKKKLWNPSEREQVSRQNFNSFWRGQSPGHAASWPATPHMETTIFHTCLMARTSEQASPSGIFHSRIRKRRLRRQRRNKYRQGRARMRAGTETGLMTKRRRKFGHWPSKRELLPTDKMCE